MFLYWGIWLHLNLLIPYTSVRKEEKSPAVFPILSNHELFFEISSPLKSHGCHLSRVSIGDLFLFSCLKILEFCSIMFTARFSTVPRNLPTFIFVFSCTILCRCCLLVLLVLLAQKSFHNLRYEQKSLNVFNYSFSYLFFVTWTNHLSFSWKPSFFLKEICKKTSAPPDFIYHASLYSQLLFPMHFG